MVRVILFFVLLGIAIGVGLWISDQPGRFELVWGSYEIQSTPGLFLVFLLAFAVVFSSVWLFIRWVFRFPNSLKRSFQLYRVTKGYKMLIDGYVALKEEEYHTAFRLARKVRYKLPDAGLAFLLEAHAAQRCEDDQLALECYNNMLKIPSIRFLGYYNLTEMALAQCNYSAATTYLDKAYAIDKDSPWVLNNLFKLYIKKGDWQAAAAVLNKTSPQTAKLKKQKRRSYAVLSYLQAMDPSTKDPESRKQLLNQAVESDAGFLPAVFAYGSLLHKTDNSKQAVKVYEKAWKQTNEISAGFAALETISTGDGIERFKLAQHFLAQTSSTTSGYLLIIIAALQARLWGEAKNYLEEAAVKKRLSRESLIGQLLSESIAGTVDISVHPLWAPLIAALSHPRWACQACGKQQSTWHYECAGCHKLDTSRIKDVF